MGFGFANPNRATCADPSGSQSCSRGIGKSPARKQFGKLFYTLGGGTGEPFGKLFYMLTGYTGEPFGKLFYMLAGYTGEQFGKLFYNLSFISSKFSKSMVPSLSPIA